jgi:NAD(P)-dependent dehydrogenase (short-subunit alcohol dehydrogenase family)
MGRYEDKKVVIIGATSGMGLATAQMLLAGGAPCRILSILLRNTIGSRSRGLEDNTNRHKTLSRQE